MRGGGITLQKGGESWLMSGRENIKEFRPMNNMTLKCRTQT